DCSVKTYDAASRSGIPESELIQANGEIHHYLTAEDPPPLAINVTNSRGVSGSLFTAKETAHMADVRDLVQMAFTVQVISAAVVLTLATLLLVLGPPRLLAIAGLGGALLTGGVLRSRVSQSLRGLIPYGRSSMCWPSATISGRSTQAGTI